MRAIDIQWETIQSLRRVAAELSDYYKKAELLDLTQEERQEILRELIAAYEELLMLVTAYLKNT